MKVILTTVGTSVLTNFASHSELNKFNDKFKTFSEFLQKNKNNSNLDKILNDNNFFQIFSFFKGLKYNTIYEKWEKKTDDEKKINPYTEDLCAEVKTIFEIIKKNNSDEFKIVLIPTHTILSQFSAQIIENFFKEPEFNTFLKNQYNSSIIEISIKRSLQLKPSEKFENEGINNLINNIKNTYDEIQSSEKLTDSFFENEIKPLFINTPGYFKKESNIDTLKEDLISINNFNDQNTLDYVIKKHFSSSDYMYLFIKRVHRKIKSRIKFIINISGGYKILVPYLTIIGQIKNMDLAYIHEDGKDLITISKLPINFDINIATLYYEILKKCKDETEIYHSTYSEYQKKVLTILENMLLIKVNKKTYKITSFGEIMIDFIKSEANFSESIFGIFIENKVFEYYVEDNFSDDKPKYTKMIHSYPITKTGRFINEVDIYLETNKPQKEKICIEIKSYSGFMHSDSFLSQINSIYSNIKPDKYIFCIYLFYDPNINDIGSNKIELRKKYEEIKTKYNKNFKAYFLPIQINPFDENIETPYENFIREKFTSSNFLDIEKIEETLDMYDMSDL
ncbi:MAG: hypothetical protein AABZ74_16055 [Cyanobacteriota bacterium]